jgi:hypothetical protein
MSATTNITESDWQPICDLLVQKLREKIAEQDHNATGALSASVEARAVELADRWRIEVLANDYGVFVNNGRRAGAKMPPIQAIYEWLKVRNIGAELATESKRRGLAFVIARSISERGISPQGGYSPFYAKGNSIERTGFADRVIEENAPQIEATIAELMGKVADWIIFNQYKNTIKHLNK